MRCSASVTQNRSVSWFIISTIAYRTLIIDTSTHLGVVDEHAIGDSETATTQGGQRFV